MSRELEIPREEGLPFNPGLTVIEGLPDGGRVLFRKPYRCHPQDNFLEVILVSRIHEYVTWVRNLQDQGLSHGNYFRYRDQDQIQAFLQAVQDFDRRGILMRYELMPADIERQTHRDPAWSLAELCGQRLGVRVESPER